MAARLARVSGEPQETDGRRLLRVKNRERLLAAASKLFAQRGYRGTTTRDIADAAGITERTLFRHVPSKAALFTQAVIAPVEAFVVDFSAAWTDRAQGARDIDVEVGDFYARLLTVLEGERHLLHALMAALAFETADPDLPELRNTLAPLLRTLDGIFAVEADLRGWTVDPVIGVRAIVGMAIALTIHQDWLFAGKRKPRPAVLVEELTKLTTWGLAGHPVTGSNTAGAQASRRRAAR